MSSLFIIISLCVIVVLLVIFIYIKRRRAKNKFNLFSGDGGVYAERGSFLKGILENLISSKKKKESEKITQDIETFYRDGEKGVGYEDKGTSFRKVKSNRMLKKSKKEAQNNEMKEQNLSLVKKEEADKMGERDKSIKKEEIHKKSLDNKKKEISIKEKNKNSEISEEYGVKEEKPLKKNKKRSSGFGFENSSKQTKIDPKKILKSLKKTDVGLILNSLKKEEYSFIADKLFKMNFDSKKDFLKTLKEELGALLKEANKELKFRVSKIRKTGKNVKNLDLDLMSVPLKITLFEATILKKDFDKVVNLMKEIDKSIKSYEKDQEKLNKNTAEK